LLRRAVAAFIPQGWFLEAFAAIQRIPEIAAKITGRTPEFLAFQLPARPFAILTIEKLKLSSNWALHRFLYNLRA